MKNKFIETCSNCGYKIHIGKDIIKEHTFNDIIATYIECPVCGENLLKQLDTKETLEVAKVGVKLESLRLGGHIKSKQAKKLKSIERKLYNMRKSLNKDNWDFIYQQLN